MTRLSRKYLFQKKYIAFFSVIPLLLITGLVQVECPVCEGSGYVSGAPGMENVVIIKTEGTQRYVNRDMNMCGMYVMYLYDVVLSVVNKGDEDTWGYAKLTLVDLKQGKAIDSQYVILEVPAATSLDVSYTVWFRSEEDTRLLRDEVHGDIVTDEVPDVTCDGKGRLALNSWLVANGLKDTFIELGRQQVQYTPPVEFDPGSEQWLP